MSDRVFVDTNILVYAHDISAGNKHQKARDIVSDLWVSGLGVISTQVLQEFYNAVTRKVPKPLPLQEARRKVSDFSKWGVVVIGVDDVLDAIDIQARYGFSFWDSLIISAAITADARVLITEDLTDGQEVRGVLVSNPLL
ncbi:MAG: PIN domain-containing protein [Actinobacteria bacterium]|nr:PIN domain-containing protein [Actinomycetota bacterium]MCG2818040.1 PIN domain-containing protein [Actinomycetes bacterium]MBU4217364.1 PIN domain-containing protein [Actinomycetota bacterium]MBU4359628.1 PIN domain-containing protein [Actinomycetota bacterium]MBU4392191.1 PIN domain-containing protein [Actinomycetota bacterium]